MLGAPVVTLAVATFAAPFGGIAFLLKVAMPAYVPCAIVLAIWFMLTRTHGQLVVATLLAPALMGIALLILFIVEDPKEIPLNAHRLSQLAFVVPFGLVVGAVFVGVAWGIYPIAKKVGFIGSARPPNNALDRTREGSSAK